MSICAAKNCKCVSNKKVKTYYDVINNKTGEFIKLCASGLKQYKIGNSLCCTCKTRMLHTCLQIQQVKRIVHVCISCCKEKDTISFEDYFLKAIRENPCMLFKFFPNYMKNIPDNIHYERFFCVACNTDHPVDLMHLSHPFKIYAANKTEIPITNTYKIMKYISQRIEAKKGIENELKEFVLKYIKAKKATPKFQRQKQIMKTKKPEKPKSNAKPSKPKPQGKPDIFIDSSREVLLHFVPKAKPRQIKRICKSRPMISIDIAKKMMADDDVEKFFMWAQTINRPGPVEKLIKDNFY